MSASMEPYHIGRPCPAIVNEPASKPSMDSLDPVNERIGQCKILKIDQVGIKDWVHL